MKEVTVSIIQSNLELLKPEFGFPTGTPQTDEMKSMVEKLRENGVATPVTFRQLRRVQENLQRDIERRFHYAILGGRYHERTDLEPKRGGAFTPWRTINMVS